MTHRLSLVGVFTLAVLALASCSSSAAQPAGAPAGVPVGVEVAVARPVPDTTEYIATLRSRRSIAVQPQVDGHVTRIFVKSGDRVEAGRPIMQIDPARQRANLTSTQANHASRRAALALAETELARSRKLVELGAVPRRELDQATSNAEALRAEVAALAAGIRSDAVQLGYYRITAPAGGVVGDIPVRVGDRVTPGTLLTTLDDNAALEAYVSVPVEQSARVAPGMEVQLVDAAGSALSTGKVTFVSPQVSSETQSILIKTDVDNQDGSLRAEQFVRARVIWGATDKLTLPPAAVVRMNGQTFVFVAEGEDASPVARMRPVVLGDLIDNRFSVRSGLTAGEKVVSSGVQKIRDGAPIAIQPAARSAAR
jgi:RND family efflux transporter MFP subunit